MPENPWGGLFSGAVVLLIVEPRDPAKVLAGLKFLGVAGTVARRGV